MQQINGEKFIVAGYTCTPIVAFAVKDLVPGKHVVGRTVAELGSGNTPTDLVPFERAGKNVIMVVNNRRPLMRIDASDVATGKALTVPEVAGIARTTLEMQSLSLRVEALDAKLDFSERRIRAMESAPSSSPSRPSPRQSDSPPAEPAATGEAILGAGQSGFPGRQGRR